jgi:hypothetical protein
VEVYIGEARSSDVYHYSRVPSKDLEGRATKKKTIASFAGLRMICPMMYGCTNESR